MPTEFDELDAVPAVPDEELGVETPGQAMDVPVTPDEVPAPVESPGSSGVDVSTASTPDVEIPAPETPAPAPVTLDDVLTENARLRFDMDRMGSMMTQFLQKMGAAPTAPPVPVASTPPADPEMTDKELATALHNAMFEGNVEAAEKVIAKIRQKPTETDPEAIVTAVMQRIQAAQEQKQIYDTLQSQSEKFYQNHPQLLTDRIRVGALADRLASEAKEGQYPTMDAFYEAVANQAYRELHIRRAVAPLSAAPAPALVPGARQAPTKVDKLRKELDEIN
jgi:hypothetical protein